MKQCKRPDCQEWKPIEEFYCRVEKADGLDSWCKGCRSKYYRQYYQDKKSGKLKERSSNPVDIGSMKPEPGLKLCKRPDCQQWKPIEEFHRRSENRDGRDTWCKDCRRGYARQYHQDKKTGKFMPTIEAQMRAMDREPRSDEELKHHNDKAYDKNHKKKVCPMCKAEGVAAYINYRQKKYCMRHESQVLETERAAKLVRGK